MSDWKQIQVHNHRTNSVQPVYTTIERSRTTILDRKPIVTERSYGCYKTGILIALFLIILLILGSFGLYLTLDNNNLILSLLIVSLIIVGLITFTYFEWQRRKAIKMREASIYGGYSTLERRLQEQKQASLRKEQKKPSQPPRYSIV